MRAQQPYGVAYLITNEVNGKRYIGVTRNSMRRWSSHKRHTREAEDRPLYRAMRKHGVENFSFVVIASARSHADLCAVETALIAQHGSFWTEGNGYNLTRGGDGQKGRIHGPETRAKMSASRKGKPKSEMWCEQRRGKPRPAHVIEALRASNIGRPKSPEQHAKLRAAIIGRPLSVEHRMKLGAVSKRHGAATAERNRVQFAGKPLSDEHKEKLRQAKKGTRPSEACIRAAIAANTKCGVTEPGE